MPLIFWTSSTALVIGWIRGCLQKYEECLWESSLPTIDCFVWPTTSIVVSHALFSHYLGQLANTTLKVTTHLQCLSLKNSLFPKKDSLLLKNASIGISILLSNILLLLLPPFPKTILHILFSLTIIHLVFFSLIFLLPQLYLFMFYLFH